MNSLLCFRGAPALRHATRDLLFVAGCSSHVSIHLGATAWPRLSPRSRRLISEHDRVASRSNEPASATGGPR
jgi:hypothetical protein